MHVIFFNTKGGVSKSTLCEYLARELELKGKLISVYNTDQQQHVKKINNNNSDFFLYDTIGAFTAKNQNLLIAAAEKKESLIVVPMNTGENDFNEIGFLVENLNKYNVINKTFFVFTKTRKNSKLLRKRKEDIKKMNLNFLDWSMPMLDDFAEKKDTKRTKIEINMFMQELKLCHY